MISSMLAMGLLIIGILSRTLIHIPNFTPVLAIALFGGVYLHKPYAILLPLALMVISDLMVGMHSTILFTWGTMILIGATGLWLRQHKNWKAILGSSLWSAILFFIVTNFGVWIVGDLYPMTKEGFVECFVMAIPFFKWTLLSTLAYTVVLFGSYEWIRVRYPKLA